MKKRGASHIEVILSFIMFITAVGFGLYFFNPSNTTRNVDIFLTYSFNEILDNSTINVETFSVRIDNNNNQIRDQNRMDNQPENSTVVKINGICKNSGTNSLVFDYTENILSSAIGTGNDCTADNSKKDYVFIKKNSTWNSTEAEFLSIVSSSDLARPSSAERTLIGVPTLKENFYVLSSSDEKKVILEKRILALNKTYFENYIGLKESFNLPSRIDFGFSLKFDSGNVISSEKISRTGTEVFSKTKRVEVLRKDTNKVEYADLVVSVW